MGGLDAETIRKIDAVLRDWRQGDAVVGTLEFLHIADLTAPLTPSSIEMAAGEKLTAGVPNLSAVGTGVHGFVLTTQSCDIVRSSKDRPFVEVAPLVEVTGEALEMVRSAKSIALAYVPGVSDRRLVADIERTMTVEKAVVAGWNRVPGCTTDQERRDLADVLRRKRGRFAFPDDFVARVRPLADRIKGKHGKNSPEGKMLASIREIRVRAAPAWDAATVDIEFIFVKNDGPDIATPEEWGRQLEKWLGLVSKAGRYQTIQGYVATMDDITGRDLVESDQLDFDYLSR